VLTHSVAHTALQANDALASGKSPHLLEVCKRGVRFDLAYRGGSFLWSKIVSDEELVARLRGFVSMGGFSVERRSISI
jgi:hypothetical protein